MEEKVVVEEELLEATGEAGKATEDTPPPEGTEKGKPGETKKAGEEIELQEGDTRRVLEIIDRLIAGEKDEGRKRLLSQLRSLVASLSKQVRKDGEEEPEVEKAGRKISATRLARLRKLLDELKGFIEEAEGASAGEKKAGDTPDKLSEIEKTVAHMAKTLGIDGEAGEDKVPPIAETVQNLAKRLEAIEGAPGQRTSLEGQEGLAGEQGGEKSMWKGLV